MFKKFILLVLFSLMGSLFLLSCTAAGGDAVVQNEDGVQLGSGPKLPEAGDQEGPAARGAASTTSDVAGVCLSAKEGELARLVNEYRAEQGLPAVPVSKSLTLVAQQHVWDSINNNPATGDCNLHSWSGNVNPALQEGTWTEVCYTDDHANAAGMWNKPREIAGYQNDGIENSFWASSDASATQALNGWKNSPGHNAVITEQGGWGPFNAMGVGFTGGIAHLWFGRSADPAGEAQLCSGGGINPTETPSPTNTPEPTATSAPTDTPEPTATSAPTNTPEPTATSTPTNTPEPTATSAPTDTPEAEATAEPTNTAEPTATEEAAQPTATATSAAAEPTATATEEAAQPTATATTASGGGPTGVILNENGTVPAGGSTQHTFNVTNGQRYTITVQPAADFDSDPSYQCNLANGSTSGGFDVGFEGDADETSIDINFGDGSCTVTVQGFGGSVGDYSITVTSP